MHFLVYILWVYDFGYTRSSCLVPGKIPGRGRIANCFQKEVIHSQAKLAHLDLDYMPPMEISRRDHLKKVKKSSPNWNEKQTSTNFFNNFDGVDSLIDQLPSNTFSKKTQQEKLVVDVVEEQNSLNEKDHREKRQCENELLSWDSCEELDLINLKSNFSAPKKVEKPNIQANIEVYGLDLVPRDIVSQQDHLIEHVGKTSDVMNYDITFSLNTIVNDSEEIDQLVFESKAVKQKQSNLVVAEEKERRLEKRRLDKQNFEDRLANWEMGDELDLDKIRANRLAREKEEHQKAL